MPRKTPNISPKNLTASNILCLKFHLPDLIAHTILALSFCNTNATGNPHCNPPPPSREGKIIEAKK